MFVVLVNGLFPTHPTPRLRFLHMSHSDRTAALPGLFVLDNRAVYAEIALSSGQPAQVSTCHPLSHVVWPEILARAMAPVGKMYLFYKKKKKLFVLNM